MTSFVGEFVLELTVQSRVLHLNAAIACTLVSRHVSTFARTYVAALRKLRERYADRFAIAVWRRCIGYRFAPGRRFSTVVKGASQYISPPFADLVCDRPPAGDGYVCAIVDLRYTVMTMCKSVIDAYIETTLDIGGHAVLTTRVPFAECDNIPLPDGVHNLLIVNPRMRLHLNPVLIPPRYYQHGLFSFRVSVTSASQYLGNNIMSAMSTMDVPAEKIFITYELLPADAYDWEKYEFVYSNRKRYHSHALIQDVEKISCEIEDAPQSRYDKITELIDVLSNVQPGSCTQQ